MYMRRQSTTLCCDMAQGKRERLETSSFPRHPALAATSSLSEVDNTIFAFARWVGWHFCGGFGFVFLPCDFCLVGLRFCPVILACFWQGFLARCFFLPGGFCPLFSRWVCVFAR